MSDDRQMSGYKQTLSDNFIQYMDVLKPLRRIQHHRPFEIRVEHGSKYGEEVYELLWHFKDPKLEPMLLVRTDNVNVARRCWYLVTTVLEALEDEL